MWYAEFGGLGVCLGTTGHIQCLSHEGSGNTQGKGSAFAMEAVAGNTQGRGSVLAEGSGNKAKAGPLRVRVVVGAVHQECLVGLVGGVCRLGRELARMIREVDLRPPGRVDRRAAYWNRYRSSVATRLKDTPVARSSS